jgi:hypothetical protein
VKLYVLYSMAISAGPGFPGPTGLAGGCSCCGGKAQLELVRDWQVEQPAAFFLLDSGSSLTSKLEHTDRNTVTFGTVSFHSLSCSPSRVEKPSCLELPLAACRAGFLRFRGKVGRRALGAAEFWANEEPNCLRSHSEGSPWGLPSLWTGTCC